MSIINQRNRRSSSQYKKGNRNKNRLLCLAGTLTVSVIFCILSLVYGKLRVDVQKNIRTDGMSPSAYIENGTEEMAQQLSSLSYISENRKTEICREVVEPESKYCDCVVADESTFQKMLAPAYTQIAGKYPKKRAGYYAFYQNTGIFGDF